jgi:hypothetical protein
MADSMVSEKWYRVCLNTIVRAGEELDSERLRILPMGSRVCVVEAAKNNGRRVRIKSPIQGWCSMSSSNGDTILAPIEDPNGDVPPTPKNISAKVNALQERRDQQKKLLEKSKNDEAFKGKVNAEKLQQDIKHLEKRVQEAELQQQERNKVFQPQEPTKGEYNMNDILICANSVIGVVKWQGTNPNTGQGLIGLEVQCGAGDCDGTHAGTGERFFKVEASSGQYVKSEDVKSVLSPISVLSKLENTINELSVTRKKYFDLVSRVETANRTGAVKIHIDENQG